MRQTWPNRTLNKPRPAAVTRPTGGLQAGGFWSNRQPSTLASLLLEGPDNPHCGAACAGLDLLLKFGER